MIPATPASAYPAGTTVEDDTATTVNIPVNRGPGARQTNVDNRTELRKQAAQNSTNERDPDADVPKVEPVPEIPGLFVFTSRVRSRMANAMIDRVTLRAPSARSLIQHGSFMKTTRKQWSDPNTRLLQTEETTIVDFAILAKHVSDMSDLDVVEVEGLNGYDMMRMSLKVQEMMYTLPF